MDFYVLISCLTDAIGSTDSPSESSPKTSKDTWFGGRDKAALPVYELYSWYKYRPSKLLKSWGRGAYMPPVPVHLFFCMSYVCSLSYNYIKLYIRKWVCLKIVEYYVLYFLHMILNTYKHSSCIARAQNLQYFSHNLFFSLEIWTNLFPTFISQCTVVPRRGSADEGGELLPWWLPVLSQHHL